MFRSARISCTFWGEATRQCAQRTISLHGRRVIMVFVGVRIVAAAISIIGSAAAYAASPAPVDLGPLADRVGDQAISVTITLKLRDLAGAEEMMRRVSTPTDPLYLQFMLPGQFHAQFGP